MIRPNFDQMTDREARQLQRYSNDLLEGIRVSDRIKADAANRIETEQGDYHEDSRICEHES